MKTDTVFKRAYNDMLDLLAGIGPDRAVPPETHLSATIGVSRTTVRKVLSALVETGAVSGGGRKRVIRSVNSGLARFPKAETVTTASQVEQRFMEWMLRDNARPGTSINELDLARRFGVATTGIREFLNRFQRFGLIERRPSGGWVFKGFTRQFAQELFEIREMFELRSAEAFARLPPESEHWRRLEQLRIEHLELQRNSATRYFDFSDLDRRFHLLIISATPNRFIDSFYDVISVIFHYHYQWNKRDERQRNEVAISEHLEYMCALFSKNKSMIGKACKKHLKSAKETLLRST